MTKAGKTRNLLEMMVIIAAFIAVFSFQQEAWTREKEAQSPTAIEKERSSGASGIAREPFDLSHAALCPDLLHYF